MWERVTGSGKKAMCFTRESRPAKSLYEQGLRNRTGSAGPLKAGGRLPSFAIVGGGGPDQRGCTNRWSHRYTPASSEMEWRLPPSMIRAIAEDGAAIAPPVGERSTLEVEQGRSWVPSPRDETSKRVDVGRGGPWPSSWNVSRPPRRSGIPRNPGSKSDAAGRTSSPPKGGVRSRAENDDSRLIFGRFCATRCLTRVDLGRVSCRGAERFNIWRADPRDLRRCTLDASQTFVCPSRPALSSSWKPSEPPVRNRPRPRTRGEAWLRRNRPPSHRLRPIDRK